MRRVRTTERGRRKPIHLVSCKNKPTPAKKPRTTKTELKFALVIRGLRGHKSQKRGSPEKTEKLNTTSPLQLRESRQQEEKLECKEIQRAIKEKKAKERKGVFSLQTTPFHGKGG